MFEGINKDMGELGVKGDLPSNLTADVAQDFVNKLSLVVAEGGSEAGNAFMDSYNNITSRMTAEETDLFTR
jgi:hypothetical protein